MLTNFPSWALWASSAAGLGSLWLGNAGLQRLRAWIKRRRPRGLDLGGIALDVVLRDLGGLIDQLDGATEPNPELTESIAQTIQSCMVAFQQSTSWKRELCPQTAQRMGDALVDALKMAEVCTPQWLEMKRTLDQFEKHLRRWQK